MMPPRKKYLVLFNRYALPVSGLITILVVFLIIVPYFGLPISSLWGTLSLLLYLLIVFVHKKPTKSSKILDKWLGHNSGGRLGIIILIWISLIYLLSSPIIGSPILGLMWPIFILPFLLFVLRKSDENELTKKVIWLTISILTVLLIGYIVGAKISETPQQTFGETISEHYPYAMILI